MFINKNKDAERLKQISNDNLEKNIPVSGIFRLTLSKISFEMLVINSDDTSVSRRFWNDNYSDFSLERWSNWSLEEGLYLDIGAHTGLYTMAALTANNKNRLLSIEPFPLNYHRIITNLRLNNLDNKNVKVLNCAVSDSNKVVKFDVRTPRSYLSKGGKINKQGEDIQAIKLDSLNFTGNNIDIKGIKIDAEGEDLKIILGAEKIIKKYKPKIIIECRKNNINEVLTFLSKLGYKNIYDADGNIFGSVKLAQFKEKANMKDIFFEFS